MLIFGNISKRGCFMAFRSNTTGGKGVTLTLPTLTLPKTTLGAIVHNVSLELTDSVTHLKCFDENIYTYTFGMDVGRAEVSFLVMLQDGKEVDKDGEGGKGAALQPALGEMLKAYSTDRVAKSQKTVTLVLPSAGGTLTGQLTGIRVQGTDEAYNIASVSYLLAIIDQPG
jgi:hypothetical protein